MSRYFKLTALITVLLTMVLTFNFVSVPVSFAKPPTKTPTPTLTHTRTPTPTPTSYGPPPGPTATPGGQPPDLIVQAMGIAGNQNCFGAGFQLGIRVYLKNNGTGNAGAFVVDVNGAQQTVSGGLAAGQTTSLWFAGYKSFPTPNNAYVDFTNLVVESNESNNSLSQLLPIPTPPPNCTPTPTP